MQDMVQTITKAEESYASWWIERNGLSPSEHSMGGIPFVAGYESGSKDMRDSIIALISPCLDRQPDLQKIIVAIEDL